MKHINKEHISKLKELERIEKKKQLILMSATRSKQRSIERIAESCDTSLMRLNESIQTN